MDRCSFLVSEIRVYEKKMDCALRVLLRHVVVNDGRIEEAG